MKPMTKKKPKIQVSTLKFIHKIIEYTVDTSIPMGSLLPPVKGRVVDILIDLDKAFARRDKLNERSLKKKDPLLSYYVKSEPLS